MFFQSSDTFEANSRLIGENPTLQANAEIVGAAVDVLKAVQALELAGYEGEFGSDLACRLLNAAYASGALALTGCYEGAAAHVGEIIDIIFLLELLRLLPAEFRRWRELSPKLRVRHFPTHRLSGKLNKANPDRRSQRSAAHQYVSRHSLHWWDSAKHPRRAVEPGCDEARLVEVSDELSRYLATAVLNLAGSLVGKITSAGPEVLDYNRRARRLLTLLQAQAA